MEIDDDNVIVLKSKAFALRCIKLYKYLNSHHKEYVLSKQVLRSGTSVGANIHEALRAQSKADFGTKMNIALKEISETEYWLELLFRGEFLEEDEYLSINTDCKEIYKILISIVKTTFKQ